MQQPMMNPYSPTQTVPMPVSSDEVYASELQREVVKNIISQLDPKHLLAEIKMRLLGYDYNPLTMEWEKIDPNKPEPPKELVERYISRLAPLLSQSTTMGYINEIQVNKRMHRFIEWISDDLDKNSKAYGLEFDFTERTRIADILLDAAYPPLTRSINGREANRIFKAISLSEYSSEGNQEQKKKGWVAKYLSM